MLDPMVTALICVDVQYDFLEGGTLAVPEGDKVIHPLELAAQEANLVIVTRDWHPANHFSFEIWPTHCVQDTKGAKIHPRIRKLGNYTISKGMDTDVDAYSAFVGETLRPRHTLEELLKSKGVQRVLIGGLALDVCVKYTALDAAALGYQTIVLLDCTRPISVEGEAKALEDFKRAGVLVQTMTEWRQ